MAIPITITGFSGGEQSKDMYPQSDIEKQKAGLKTCSNMIVNVRGSVSNRAGTEYIADCKTPATASRLVPFQFNETQSYMLEFTPGSTMRVIRDGALVTSAGVPYFLSTDIGDNLQTFDYWQSADTLYIFQQNSRLAKITRTEHNAWTYTSVTGMDGAYKPRVEGDEDVNVALTHAGGTPAATSWTVTASSAIFGDTKIGDAFKVGWQVPLLPESLDWVFGTVDSLISSTVVTVSFPDTSATYTPATEVVQNYDFTQGSTFWKDLSTDEPANTTITYDLVNDLVTLVDSTVGEQSQVGQQIYLLSNRVYEINVEVGTIGSGGTGAKLSIWVGHTPGAVQHLDENGLTTSDTTYTYEFKTNDEIDAINWVTLSNKNSQAGESIEIKSVSIKEKELDTYEWRLAAWNTTYGFPRYGAIHEQRLYMGNIDTDPQMAWASELGEFEKFGFHTPLLSTDSFSFKPSTDQINGILWFKLYNGLNLGTADAIWRIFSASGGAVNALDINIKVDSNVNTLPLNPVVAGNSLITTPRGMAAVSELTSSLEASGYVPRDLSILAPHLFENRRIIHWAYAKSPDSVIWCVLDNGTLLGLTYIKEYDIWAWHTHSTPMGEGFKDVAVIPNSSDDNIDDVYFVVNRAEVGETGDHYLEKLSTRITPQTAAYGLSASGTPHDYRFLDSAVTLGYSASFISGVTKANPGVVTTTAAHGLEDGKLILIDGVFGMTELNGNEYRVANKAATTFELTDKATGANIDTSAFTTYVSDGTVTQQVPTITGATQADPVVITANSHGHSNGDDVRIQNVVGMTELNDNVYLVANKTATTFEITDLDGNDIDGTAFTAYLTGGEVREMVTAISGLDHLEGETVTALADGRIRADLTVSSGAVTLPNSASFVHIGLPYVSQIETHDIDAFLRSGNTQNKKKIVKNIAVYFKDTLSGEAGTTSDSMTPFAMWEEVDGGEVPDLRTGFYDVNPESKHKVDETMIIQQVDPYPMTISRIIAEVEFNED